MESAKIYGLCIERLNYQIANAKKRINGNGNSEKFLLESYNTGELEDIVDILELYDIEEHTIGSLREKLEDLSCTVSVLTREELFFDFDEKGHLGLFLGLWVKKFAGQELEMAAER
jgi:hypothetical protein